MHIVVLLYTIKTWTWSIPVLTILQSPPRLPRKKYWKINCTHCGAILEFFNIQQNKITHSNTSYIYEPTYEADGVPLWRESIRGWRTVYATDNYIYIALNGTKDIETRIEKLSVFDWWGCPIKQYDLGVNIMDIIIDESSKTGYVIYRDDEYEYQEF